MAGLFPCLIFQGFGPTSLDPAPEGTWHLVDGPKRSVLRKGVRECCPKRPPLGPTQIVARVQPLEELDTLQQDIHAAR